MSNLPACAHISISWRTERIGNGTLTRGWWECDSNCGTKFWPRPAALRVTLTVTRADVGLVREMSKPIDRTRMDPTASKRLVDLADRIEQSLSLDKP